MLKKLRFRDDISSNIQNDSTLSTAWLITNCNPPSEKNRKLRLYLDGLEIDCKADLGWWPGLRNMSLNQRRISEDGLDIKQKKRMEKEHEPSEAFDKKRRSA